MLVYIVVCVFLTHSFQSERESGDRNFAIGYYLKEKKVGPTRLRPTPLHSPPTCDITSGRVHHW